MKTITPQKTGVSRYLTLLFTQILCIVWILSSVSYAQPTGLPKDINGDPEGWQHILPNSELLTVYGSAFIKDAVNSSQDNQLAQQAKDVNDIDTWHWNLGNTNDKTDITNVGAAIVTDEGTGHTYLIFFGDRISPKGDANIGFWLLLNATDTTCDDPPDCSEGMFAPEHNDGDLLVLSNFLNGGGEPDVRVYRWDGGAMTDVTGSVGHGAAVNDEYEPVPPGPNGEPNYISPDGDAWTFLSKSGSTGYETGLFFEGYINLNEVVNDEDLCDARVMFETRNSPRLNAQLGDFASDGFNITPDPPVMVPNEACYNANGVDLTLEVLDPKINMFYEWYDEFDILVHSGFYEIGAVYTPNLLETTTYWVTATNFVCPSDPATVTGTINPLPPCGITGSDAVCPNSTDIEYTGPAATEGVTSWEWDISGNGEITSVNDNVITVDAYGGCDESFVLTLTTTNIHGCICTEDFEVLVGDVTPPTFTRPPDITVYRDADCNYYAGVDVTGDVEDEADNCGVGEAEYSDEVDETDPCNVIITRTWTLIDDCGREAEPQIQTITVKDNTPPTFTAPGNTTIYSDEFCAYDADPLVTGDVTDEEDNCGVGEAQYSDDLDESDPCNRIITRTWTLSDNCGNASEPQTQIITIKDNIPPTFTRPPDITIYRDENCGYDASVSNTGDVTDEKDNCGVGEATFKDAVNDSDPCEVIITRTWSLSDDCGNPAADQVQTITVEDNTPPTFTRPPDITIYRDENCDYDAGVAYTGDVTDENDNCGVGEATFDDVVDETDPCAVVIKRTWSLVDDCDNAAEDQVQTITVEDNTPPTFTRPPDITIYRDADCEYDASVLYTGDVEDEADNCGVGEATFVDVVNDLDPCEVIITRTWSLVDDCDNAAADQVQTITVEDNTPPTFTRPPDITIYRDADCEYDASVTYTGDVTDEDDNCGVGEATFMDAVNDLDPCEVIITRTWSLVDDCGNPAADQIQTITVEDNIPPTFTRPPDITIYSDADCNYYAGVDVTGDVTDEADNCGVGEATFEDEVDYTDPCAIIITRTWSLVDECGNPADDQFQTITVEDNIAPTLSNVPEDITIGCNEPFTFEDPTVTDNCDPDPILHWTRSDGRDLHDPYFEPASEVTICFWGEDCAGNISEPQECFTVTVEICGLCFYTKGFYGNEGGLGWTVDCDMQYSASQMMQAVLPEGYEEFGTEFNNFKLVSSDLTLGYIFNMLPGGSTPAVLGGGVATYANPDSWWIVPLDPDNNGSILNNLLAQTLAFYFNLGNNPDGPDHTIGGNVLVTMESDCDFEMTYGEPESFPIPQAVIDELNGNPAYDGGATLRNLLQLAKDVLGGANTNVTPANVTAALDAFNKGFDECRAFIEYQNYLSAPAGGNTTAAATIAEEIEVKAYPNPFRGDVTIEFTVPQTTHVTLEIYTIDGRRVETIYTGMAEKDAIHSYHFDGKGMKNQSVFIFVIKSEYGINMGKLIRLK